MRIANVIEEGKLGGPQVRICSVAAALKGQVETTVIMPAENSQAFCERCDALGVTYKTIPLTRITKEWNVAIRYVLFSIFEVLWLAWILRRAKFDVVHVSGGAWQYKGVLAAKLAGIKVLWHLNDSSLPWLFRTFFAVMTPLSNGYIYSAKRAETYYKNYLFAHRLSCIIPPPVDTAYYSPYRNYSGCDELTRKCAGKLVVGTIANVNPIKGLDVFIKAAKILNDKFDNLLFLVVGQISGRQSGYYIKLQELASNLNVRNLIFLGARSDVRNLLNQFDYYVCSSYSETGPMTLWEAMAMEKVVVSTDVGDVTQYIQNGYNGFVVPVGDAQAMADAIVNLVNTPELRGLFGKRAREVACRELDIDIIAAKTAEAYRSVLEKVRIK
ncbi:MAG: glycosyltransferase family 4 protein [Gallionella sp.]|nr:glycosyltransferase family 4 protein [Gallionella sp.]